MTITVNMPRDRLPEASLALLTDVFETRLLFERTVCTCGEEAARLLYDAERFVRAGRRLSGCKRRSLG